MNGEEVAYDSLYISHRPEFKYNDFDGKEIVEAASTHLDFSVSAQIGQLEANISYRVKANDENGILLVKGGKPDFMKKKGKDKKDDKKSKDSKPGDKKSEKKDDDKKGGDKPNFEKFKKKSKSVIEVSPDPRSQMGQKLFWNNVAERIADSNEGN